MELVDELCRNAMPAKDLNLLEIKSRKVLKYLIYQGFQ